MSRHGAHRGTRAAFVVAVAILGVLIGPSTSRAHAGDESYVYLDVADDDLRGQVEMPYRDIRTVLGLDLDGSDAENRSELADHLDSLQTYAAQHLSIGDASGSWDLVFDGVLTLEEAYGVDGGEYAIFPFVVELGGIDVPQVLTVSFDPFFDDVDGSNALLLIANDWKRGVFDNEAESLVQFDSADRTKNVDLGSASQWKNFSESVNLGVDHIKTGPDHVFFVLVLVLPSVLVYSAARWRPTDTFGSSLWRVLKIVSMFTVAHSITFTLAGLGLLPLPPSRLVESIIAASIAAAALHNLRPIGPNKEWMIAFAFGLFHGMGFASLVSELEVSESTQLISLLGRNVGIEIGQAFVVLVVFPGLFFLRRTVYYRPFFLVGSLVLAFVSLGWMMERILDIEVGTTDVIDKVMKYPRVMIPVVAFDLVCAAIYWRERSQGRLLPVGGDPSIAHDDDIIAVDPEHAALG